MKDKISLTALCDIWLAGKAETTEKTYRAYITNADFAAKRLYNKQIMDVSTTELQHIWAVTTGKFSKRSQNVRYFVFRSFFNVVQNLGLREDHPMILLKAPKFEDRLADRIMTHEDALAVISAGNSPRDVLLMRTMYQAGLRVKEAVRLRADDLRVSGDVFTLRVWGKGERTDYVRIPADLGKALSEWRAGKNFLFTPFGKDKPLAPIHGWKIVKGAGQKVGLPKVSPHFFRHTHASVALQNGAKVPVLQKSLRHKDIKTTLRYVHLQPDEGSSLFIPPIS